MATLELGRRLLSSFIKKNDIMAFHDAKLSEVYFSTELEKEAFNMVHSHITTHGVLPSLDTIASTIGELPEAYEPPSFYLKELQEKYKYRLLNSTLKECGDFIKTKDIEAISKAFEKALMDFRLSDSRQTVMDFGLEAHDLFKHLHAKNYTLDNNIYTGWPTLDKLMNGLGAGDICSIIGRPASGKAQPLDAKILTARGFMSMGDITVGTPLASIDGSPSIVTGVYPQGEKQTYAVTFTDGRVTECCGEHLWEVSCNYWGATKTRVVNTLTLISYLDVPSNQKHLSIKTFSGDFGEDVNLTIDPYLLGALIGDGGFTGSSVMLSTADDDMLTALNSVVEAPYFFMHRSNYDYALVQLGTATSDFSAPRGQPNLYKDALIAMGLWGCKSEDKFIPFNYLNSTRSSRLSLLQGLMDTDGTVSKECSASYSTSSKILAYQVLDLVRSLGGRCSGVRVKKTKHLDSYRLHFKLHNPRDIFRLERKRSKVPIKNGYANSVAMTIDNITPSRTVPCQCISVSHPSKLYITDDYIVTHNTFLGLWVAYNVYLLQRKNVLFVSMEMSKPILTQRLSAIITKSKLFEVLVGQLSTYKLGLILETLKDLEKLPQKLYIIDGALSSTVAHIESYIQLYKPELVAVDGAYLLQHPNTRISKFERVGDNIRSLKQLAERYKIPILLSYQFNREAAKKGKKGEEAGLEDIGSSDDIGQISSVVLSLKQPESAETLKQRAITVIKGRNGGENTQILINWNFDKLDFSEVADDSSDLYDDSFKDSNTLDDIDSFND